MGEHEQHPVEVGLEPIAFELHEPGHRMAEQRAGRAMHTVASDQIDRDDGAERAGIGAALFHEIDAPLTQQHFRIDDVDVLDRRLEEACRESCGDQPGVAGGDLATIGDRARPRGAVVELCEQLAEPPGEVEEAADAVELGRVDRGRIHRMPDRARREEVHEQADTLDRHL